MDIIKEYEPTELLVIGIEKIRVMKYNGIIYEGQEEFAVQAIGNNKIFYGKTREEAENKFKDYILKRLRRKQNNLKKEAEKIHEKESEIKELLALVIKEKGLEKILQQYPTLQNKLGENK